MSDYDRVRAMTSHELLTDKLAAFHRETRGYALESRIDELMARLAKADDPLWAVLYVLRQIADKPSGFNGVIATRPARDGEY